MNYVVQYNYLGLLLDNEMNLQSLFKNIKKRVSNKLFSLRKLRKYLTHDAAILVYKQTILPIFDYAGFFLLITLNKGDKHELQIMQNDAINIVRK